MKTTEYYLDFMNYYEKAAHLQNLNLSSPTGRDVELDPGFHDPLMQYVTIYDCVERRYAGFSNALQQLWYGSENPKRWQINSACDKLDLDVREWLWLFLVHRLTGSGASFSHDHGFRNSSVRELAWILHYQFESDATWKLCERIENGPPVFTSIGNQIPAFPKPRPPHSKGSQVYFAEYSWDLVDETIAWLTSYPYPPRSIKETVDFVCAWHKDHGLKQFHFVLTAWVMDIAEYYSYWVHSNSHCYYGKNALESLALMFEGFKKRDADEAMERIMSATGNKQPMSIEDVLCDYVRYIEHYVPKGYEHLEPWQVENSSLVDHPVRHPSYLKIVGK